ncbi:SprT-like domain-containing protein [Gloeobacter morelensis]|uniref:SprT-like domain-containing protein n=1 Tax=Gloeobacter morelensis TaxID=2907343 RepID=UPI001E4EEC98|nr:SprT-like domain-containing protein [Gloeobacter morelensis]
MEKPPTTEQWSAYQAAFNYFNKELFGNGLPHCILNFSRHNRSFGFFAPERWEKRTDRVHEISLNPDTLDRPLADVMATLCHEMCHLWRHLEGKPPSCGYHDKRWASKMVQIGLLPTSTGEPGGKQTGKKVHHLVQENGPFERAFRKMPDGHLLPWRGGQFPATGVEEGGEGGETAQKQRRDKLKFTCPNCAANCWGKESLKVRCGVCNEQFVQR